LGSSLSNKNFNSSMLSNLSAEMQRRPPKPIYVIFLRCSKVRFSTNKFNADGAHRTVSAWARLTGFLGRCITKIQKGGQKSQYNKFQQVHNFSFVQIRSWSK
jgi:hypothetical protein